MQCVAFRLMGVTFPHVKWAVQAGRKTRGPTQPCRRPAGRHATICGRPRRGQLALGAGGRGLEPFEAFYLATDTVVAEETRVVVERCYPTSRRWRNLKAMRGSSVSKKRSKSWATSRNGRARPKVRGRPRQPVGRLDPALTGPPRLILAAFRRPRKRSLPL